jgi:hypothetical protein
MCKCKLFWRLGLRDLERRFLIMVPELMRQLEKNSNPVAVATNGIRFGNNNFPYFDQLIIK